MAGDPGVAAGVAEPEEVGGPDAGTVEGRAAAEVGGPGATRVEGQAASDPGMEAWGLHRQAALDFREARLADTKGADGRAATIQQRQSVPLIPIVFPGFSGYLSQELSACCTIQVSAHRSTGMALRLGDLGSNGVGGVTCHRGQE